MTTPLRSHIDSLINASLSIEEGLRNGGFYSRDCAANDALDAVARRSGKRGFAVLFDEHDPRECEVVPLGEGTRAHLRKQDGDEGNSPDDWEESYEHVGEHAFEKRANKSHERDRATEGTGKFHPVQIQGDPEGQRKSRIEHAAGDKRPAMDAARQRRLTADARRFSSEQLARNERFAQQTKAASAKIWNGR